MKIDVEQIHSTHEVEVFIEDTYPPYDALLDDIPDEDTLRDYFNDSRGDEW